MKNKRINIIFILLIIIFTISIIGKEVDSQTFLSIKLGQDILEFGINNSDKYCNIQELKYINPNWLFDVIVGGIYNLFEFYGIYIFKIIISIIMAISLFYVSNKRGSNIIISFFMTIITIFLLNKDIDHYGFDLKVVSYLIFILEILFIESFLENGKIRYLISIFISSLILVNLNAFIWPLYFVIYFPYFIENILFKIFEKKNLKTDLYKIKILNNNKRSNILVGVFVFTILTGFINPNGAIGFTYWYKVLKGATFKYISEFAPLISVNSIGTCFTLLMVISIFSFTKIKIRISECLIIFLLTLLAIYSVKNIIILQLIGSIIISRNITEFINLYPDSKKEIEKAFFNKNAILVLALIITCLAGYNLHKTKDEDYLYGQIPTNIVKYIKTHDNIKLYNELDMGNYLIFNDIQVFIDTRYEMYCKEFNNTEIFDNYCKIILGKEAYKNIFEKYGINYVLIHNKNIINTYMQKDVDYINMCEDGDYILYKKIN